jgi:hypothetical protein
MNFSGVSIPQVHIIMGGILHIIYLYELMINQTINL